MIPIASKVTTRNNGIQVLSHQNLQKAISLSRFVLFICVILWCARIQLEFHFGTSGLECDGCERAQMMEQPQYVAMPM